MALHQTGHGHSHGAPGEQPNASVRAAFVHVVGDLLQSVGVLVASYVIFFKVGVVLGAEGTLGRGTWGWWLVQSWLHVGVRWMGLSPMGIWRRGMALGGDLTLCHLSQPEYKYVDPICTFLFSALVLGTTLTILRDVLLVLMEGRDLPGPGDGENHPRVP